MPATLDQVRRGGPGTDQAALKRCAVAGSRASVRGVGGTDALLAARLAAGDDHALAEVFDRLAPVVYGAALGVLGNGAAASAGLPPPAHAAGSGQPGPGRVGTTARPAPASCR